jgi:hypothetical protein
MKSDLNSIGGHGKATRLYFQSFLCTLSRISGWVMEDDDDDDGLYAGVKKHS